MDVLIEYAVEQEKERISHDVKENGMSRMTYWTDHNDHYCFVIISKVGDKKG